MKYRLFPVLLFMAFASLAWSTDLRGRIDGRNAIPLPGVPIGLFWPNPDGTFTLVRQAATGPDGMYYLRIVAPGNYVLQVAGVNYPLAVGNGPLQDIPVILR